MYIIYFNKIWHRCCKGLPKHFFGNKILCGRCVVKFPGCILSYLHIWHTLLVLFYSNVVNILIFIFILLTNVEYWNSCRTPVSLVMLWKLLFTLDGLICSSSLVFWTLFQPTLMKYFINSVVLGSCGVQLYIILFSLCDQWAAIQSLNIYISFDYYEMNYRYN